ncbi:DUF1465 family protein [Bartonella sp. DGB1]|uniref:DUF1465 family protein n=1 Tax=Bartonella sp. DGB1 TaxID=3239807 RepID=UPI00352468E2
MVKKNKNLVGFDQLPQHILSVVHESFSREFPSLYNQTMTIMAELHSTANQSKYNLPDKQMTQFMHMVCWILLYRSLLEGEISYQQMQSERDKIMLKPLIATEEDKQQWSSMALSIEELFKKIWRFHKQLIEAEQQMETTENPVAKQLDKLKESLRK